MNTDAPGRLPVEILVDEFLERYRRGERPSVKEYQEHHPELAIQIEEIFPALVWLEQAAHDSVNDRSRALEPNSHPPKLEQLGDFRIIREIGRGGMGVVYEAEQESLGRRVALKILPGNVTADSKLALRFEREARAAARLHHTNIVPVFGVGQQDGLHYYVMPCIDGQGLDQVLKELRRLRRAHRDSIGTRMPPQGGPSETPSGSSNGSARQVAQSLFGGRFPPHDDGAFATQASDDPSPISAATDVGPIWETKPGMVEASSHSGSFTLPGQSSAQSGTSSRSAYWLSVARIGIQAAQALQHAHDQGVVHRDIKPANLLLDLHGTVWVTDFGLAKATDQGNLTQTGDVLGTLRYMAPEQFEGRSDARTDIYSLGLTIYELLALRPAFEERDRPNLIRMLTTGAVPRLRALDPYIPRDLETIVHKAIDREPEHRYPSAQAMADDLRRFEHGEPIQARPLAVWEKCWKWCRRSPVLTGLSAAVLLLLLTVTSGSLIAARIYQGQRNSLKQAVVRLEKTTDQLKIERDRFLVAEAAERGKRSEALFDKTRMGRFSGRIGRRFQGLTALDESVRIERSLSSSLDALDPRIVDRRSEAIACFGLHDLLVLERHPIDMPNLNQMHARSGLRAQSPDRHTIQFYIHDRWLGDVETGVPDASIMQLAISHDGKLVAAAYQGPSKGVCIWNGATRELIRRHDLSNAPGWIGFSRNGRVLAGLHLSGEVAFIPTDRDEASTTTMTIANAVHAAFSPDDRELAICSEANVILVLGVDDGLIRRELTLDQRPTSLDWSMDGTKLAVGGYHGHVQVLDAQTAKIVADVGGHKHAVTNIFFHPSGNYVVTSSWDGTTRLWSVPLQKEVLRDSAWLVGPGFDPDGLRLSFVTVSEIGVWELNLAPECRILAGHAGTTVIGSTFHPQSRVLATWGYDGVQLWDATSGEALAFLDVGWAGGAAFDQHGNLFTSSEIGQLRWPVSWTHENRDVFQVGPPEPTSVWHSNSYLTIAKSADRLAYVVSHDGRAAVRDLASRKTVPLVRDGDLSVIAMSSSGKWVAGTPQHTEGVTVWDAATGVEVRQLPTTGWAACAFSPDEAWLAVSDVRQIRFWRTSDWTLSRVVPSPGTGCVAFSPDNRLLARAKYLASGAANAVELLDLASGRLVARLETTPAPTQIERFLTFSPDGRYLVVPHYSDGVFALWDLTAVRDQLEPMHLDWIDVAPALPPSSPSSPSTPIVARIRSETLDAIRHQRKANEFLTGKQYESVITEVDAGLKLAPEDADLWYVRGRGLSGLREYQQAVDDYARAIAIRPGHVEALHYRGHAHGSLKHYSEALADFETVCREQPDDPHLLDVLGRYRRHSGQFAEAAAAWRMSLTRLAAPTAQHDLASLLLVGPESLRNAAEAAPLADAAWKADGKRPAWLATLGMAKYRLGRFEEAAEILDRAAAAHPFGRVVPPMHQFFRAMAWSARGDAVKARELYDRAVADATELTDLSPGDRALLDQTAAEARKSLGIE